MGENLRSLGEFGFVRRIAGRLPGGEGVQLGIGDDGAAVETGPSTLVTVDMLVEGTHFDLALSSPRDVGFKAIACSASDVAAMGGRPRFAVVAFGAPPDSSLGAADAYAEGIREGAGSFDVSVVGGDTVRAPAVTLCVTLLGDPGPGGPITRAGARPGDLLCLTGRVGAAAAALRLHRAGELETLERFPTLLAAHRRGGARVREGLAAAAAGARAMIDVSDGVGADASHVADASGVGVVVVAAAVPLGDGVREAAKALDVDPVRLALAGGDDYELLIAVHPHDVSVLVEAVAPTPLSVVGEFSEGDAGIVEWPDGSREPLRGLGWDGFA